MHWIIGTAGHIDHGKTSLVKALTGQDTDRLKEEKDRGISIDLGFAHLDLPDGSRAGIVDVPGHERFIRNMLAGAHGLDVVLFTIAADDGVMPQTREHLDILHLLGVTRAVVVVTKADIVSDHRLQEVRDEIAREMAGTALAGAPIVTYSFMTRSGLDDVRAQIGNVLRNSRRPPRTGVFRLPVDRTFVSPGHGLVVTGTAVSGEIRTGDVVRRLPGGETLRVRRVEVHNEAVDVATWGQRVALNLVGQTGTPIVRGDVICHESLTLICDRFDARVEVRPTASAALEDHQPVRVHLGTAERMGKIIPLGSRRARGATRVEPGQTAYCQISLTAPLLAMRGDRFILRDAAAQHTIAGGVVLLAAATPHKRRDPLLLERLEALDGDDDVRLLGAIHDERCAFALPLPALAELLNRPEAEVRLRFEQLDGVRVFDGEGGPHYATARACQKIGAALLPILQRWHAAHPLGVGVDLEEARVALGEPISPRIFRRLVQELIDEHIVDRVGPLLRASGHKVALPDADRTLAERIIAQVGRDPLSPPDVKRLAADLAVDLRRVSEVVRVMERDRSLVCVAPDLYFLPESIDRVRADLIRQLTAAGDMTTAQFRDRHHTSRKYAIPLLEYFDRTGVTVRIGEVRRLRHARTDPA